MPGCDLTALWAWMPDHGYHMWCKDYISENSLCKSWWKRWWSHRNARRPVILPSMQLKSVLRSGELPLLHWHALIHRLTRISSINFKYPLSPSTSYLTCGACVCMRDSHDKWRLNHSSYYARYSVAHNLELKQICRESCGVLAGRKKHGWTWDYWKESVFLLHKMFLMCEFDRIFTCRHINKTLTWQDQFNFYLRQGGDVFACIYLSVCLLIK